MGVTTLKKRARDLGIVRWPYRRVSKIMSLKAKREVFIEMLGEDKYDQEVAPALEAALVRWDTSHDLIVVVLHCITQADPCKKLGEPLNSLCGRIAKFGTLQCNDGVTAASHNRVSCAAQVRPGPSGCPGRSC